MDKKLKFVDLDECVSGLLLQLMEAREVVVRERLAAEKRQKKQYDTFRVLVNFDVGDVVFKKNDRGKGTAAKFTIPWTGPYKIVKKKENGVDWTIESADGDTETVHVTRLAAFHLSTEVPLTMSEDMTEEEESVTKVLEEWRRERFSQEYGQMFSSDEKRRRESRTRRKKGRLVFRR